MKFLHWLGFHGNNTKVIKLLAYDTPWGDASTRVVYKCNLCKKLFYRNFEGYGYLAEKDSQ